MQEVVLPATSRVAFPLDPNTMYAFPAEDQSFTPGERVIIVLRQGAHRGDRLWSYPARCQNGLLRRPHHPRREEWFDQYRRVFASV